MLGVLNELNLQHNFPNPQFTCQMSPLQQGHKILTNVKSEIEETIVWNMRWIQIKVRMTINYFQFTMLVYSLSPLEAYLFASFCQMESLSSFGLS
jgi:hypothetical protein